MAKKALKEELLKMLKSDMNEMKKESKKDLFDGIMPKKEKMQKVTVMADSKEGLEEGLSKAQQIMKAKLGIDSESEDSEEMEHECSECKKMPCKC